ncbi:MAG TPA: hypothetical protein ACFYD3_06395 [Candidatus Hypogeohydataceae bacterium YC41]
MKSFLSLILALAMAVFLAGPAMANPVSETQSNDSTTDAGHIFLPILSPTNGPVGIADNMEWVNGDTNITQVADGLAIVGNDAMNLNLSASNVGSGQRNSVSVVAGNGGSIGLSNTNVSIGGITQSIGSGGAGAVQIASVLQENN